MIALAHEQVAAQRTQQAGYETIIARYGNRPDRPELASRVRSAELGIRLARTAAEFWEEILERETEAVAA